MIRIIYDASVLVSGNILSNEHKTGLYRVSNELLRGLVKFGSYEIYLFDVFFRERELRQYVQKQFPECSVIRIYSNWYRGIIFPVCDLSDRLRNIETKSSKRVNRFIAWLGKNVLLLIGKIARKIERTFFISKNINNEVKKCSIYYSTYFPVPELIRENKYLKKIYTIHDLIPLIHPEYFVSSFNSLLVREVVESIKENDFVICVSESTKKDFLSFKPEINPSKVIVAHLAAANSFHSISDHKKIIAVLDRFNIPSGEKYLLSVCTFEPRKNLKTLVAAFRILLGQGKVKDLSLVLTGAPYWDKDPLLYEIEILNRSYNNQIIITGFVQDEDLAILYNGAYAFVYPSFYEGFGLPPLEAMQCGVPVICSKTSSLPEVVGDCGILFDPVSETELVNAITLLYEDNNLRNTLSQKALKRATRFSWSETNHVIHNVFDLALSGK